MPLMKPEQYEESLKARKPRVFMNGQRETSLLVFDNVFIPWERVFHCGESPYSVKLVTRFARTHRMTCGGICKVGFMNQIIGAARLIQEYKGLGKVPHINEQLAEMVVLREDGSRLRAGGR